MGGLRQEGLVKKMTFLSLSFTWQVCFILQDLSYGLNALTFTSIKILLGFVPFFFLFLNINFLNNLLKFVWFYFLFHFLLIFLVYHGGKGIFSLFFGV